MDTTTKREGNMDYNATAYKLDGEKIYSVQAVEVVNGKVVRAAGYWTHTIGTEAYDADWRGTLMGRAVRIELDGAAGYRNRLRGLALPPAYTEA
jgi:hypothetical protein